MEKSIIRKWSRARKQVESQKQTILENIDKGKRLQEIYDELSDKGLFSFSVSEFKKYTKELTDKRINNLPQALEPGDGSDYQPKYVIGDGRPKGKFVMPVIDRETFWD